MSSSPALCARPLSVPVLLALGACSAADYRDDADAQVYDILDVAAEHVTGRPLGMQVERASDTLRQRLIASPTPVQLSLPEALDVAAENSRDFQRQKESLYLAALALTREQHDFAVRFGFSSAPEVSGVGDDSAVFGLRNDLTASKNTEAGGRVVASFVNTFLKNLVSGGSFNGTSLLSLAITQPLMRSSGRRIAREPLTQAERDVIYSMRDFERFRATFSVRIVADYYRVLQDIDDLASETANLDGTRKNRERVEALVEAGQLAGIDLDRARSQEFDAEDRLNSAQTRLQSTLDRFKLTLGLPVTVELGLDAAELETLRDMPVIAVELAPERAAQLALARRLDYRVSVDEVEDAGRRVLVAEDALRTILDFSAVIDVPTEPSKPFSFDWENIGWAVGFDLDLALDRLPERNAYRSALIGLDAAMRGREQAEDEIVAEIRDALRSVERTINSHRIQRAALEVAETRLERAELFLQAGRGDTLALLDAQEELLASKLNLTGAIVDYAIARLELLRDLEGLALEPSGLRYDPSLPLPRGPLAPYRGTETSAAEAPEPAP